MLLNYLQIMDLLQTRYPDMIVAMYSSASDLLLLNILPSQVREEKKREWRRGGEREENYE